MDDQIGVMICGHGSRDPQAIQQLDNLVNQLRQRLPFSFIEVGYLEFAHPTIREGLDRLRSQGMRHILAVPGMLLAAGHTKNDIPSVLNEYQTHHPEVRIDFGRDLGISAKMLQAAGERINRALSDYSHPDTRDETVLIVVGRGSSDPDANADIAKIARMLTEGLGFGWGEVAYSGVTFPLVEPALERIVRLGFRRIVVFPYFLFTGILVKRIYHHTDRVASRYPQIEFLKADYLHDHPLVIDSFIERVMEILEGIPAMNCQLCKYRTAILGFENDVGCPQVGHHHHVEGIGTDDASHTHHFHDA